VASVADRVAVMYAGRIVEEGPTSALLSNPAHPYTRHLLAAVPDPTGRRAVVGLAGFAPGPGERPPGCSFAPRCSLAHDACRAAMPSLDDITDDRRVRCVAPFAVPRGIQHPGTSASPPAIGTERAALSLEGVCAAYNGVRVLHDIAFDIERGECLALVGKSGSGKTTLVRSIGGLHHEWTGEIRAGRTPLATRSRARTVAQRLAIQFVFQNPYQSLNPRRTVGQSVARPLRIGGRSKDEAWQVAGEMLERVSLNSRVAQRYPDQLSGGERQRAAIARALVSTPDILICDEVTSALDSVVQAAIVELLVDLQRDLGLSMVFVTHNLPLVSAIAGRVAVMADGRIVEIGPTSKVLTDPDSDHTKNLLGHMLTVPAAGHTTR
jgi:peptide/nickel transport system ATP-binding protein